MIPALAPQVASGVLIFGLILKIAGFIVRDELLLRVLVASGLACDAIFYLFRAEPIFLSVGANVLLVSVNFVLIVLIVFERTTWGMRAAELELYRHFETLTPGQYRRLRRKMGEEDGAAGMVLASEGKPVADLMLVFADQIMITKSGDSFPIAGPAFVGEIAFLTGEPSSADVALPDGGRVLRMSVAELRKMMARSPALHNALIALFGHELARKVAYSVPMERAALAPDGSPSSEQRASAVVQAPEHPTPDSM